jgi:hypothetical protein
MFIVGLAPEPPSQSDRTAVIVGAAWVNIFLELVITTRFAEPCPGIFKGNGILCDTAAKIQMLFA